MPTPAVIRTIVPAIVGAVISFLIARGIQVDDKSTEALTYVLTVVLTGAYYVVILKLEARWPSLGILLGSTARPIYEGRHRKASSDPATATSDSPDARL
ncbi:hypothetical protein [Streptomyces sp. NPDC088752]|uniref:hypothetical protein n=1 Tax=Streptomyces sp. NPDC088752 TaxID=3154963 RepID=UPI00341AB008